MSPCGFPGSNGTSTGEAFAEPGFLQVGSVLVDSQGMAYRVSGTTIPPAKSDEGSWVLLRPVTFNATALSRRQQEVARLMAMRASNREIAAALHITVHTARHHSQAVLKKLGLRRRSELREWAIQLPDWTTQAAAKQAEK